MKGKSILYFLLLVLLVLSLGFVSASENITDTQIITDVESSPIGEVSVGEQSIDLSQVSSNYDDEFVSQDSDLQSPLKEYKGEKLVPSPEGSDLLGEQQVPEVHVEPNVPETGFKLTVNKVWENNDSGDVKEIFIQILKEYNALPIWKSSELASGETVGDFVDIEINGTLRKYEIVAEAILNKENNWTFVLNNIYPNLDEYYNHYTGFWVFEGLDNDYEYIVREFNLPDKTEHIHTIFKGMDYDTHERGYVENLTLYWEIANRYLHDNETVNDTVNDTVNETPDVPVNDTIVPVDNVTIPVVDNVTEDVSIVEKNESTDDVQEESVPETVEKKVLDVENATGNPLVVLLVVLAVLGAGLRRRD